MNRLTPIILAVVCSLLQALPASAAAEYEPPRSIVFSRTTQDGTHIFRMEPDGSGLVGLTSGSGRDTEPAWNVDGTLVSFTRRAGDRTDTWLVGADGTGAYRFIARARSLAWSEDGTKVVFVRIRRGNADIWIADVDGSDQVRLTSGAAWDGEPSWTIDGRIVFASDRSGQHRVHVLSATGTGVHRLTDGPGSQRDPVWSNIGQLVYEQHRAGDSDIYWLWPSDEVPHLEVTGPADDRDPAVAMDGELVFQRVRRDGSSVLVHTWVGDFPLTVLPSPTGSTNSGPGWVPSLAWIEAQDVHAKANLLEAADTAQAIRDSEGSFDAADPISITAANPSLEYVDSTVDSTGPYQVSISANGAVWAGAVLSDSGLCYWIRLEDGVATKYGLASAATCSGTDATNAIDAEW